MGLRPYQTDCHDAVKTALETHRSTMYVLATGCGKTQVFSELCRTTPGRIMVLAHRNELIQQAALRIEQATGERPDIEMGDSWARDASAWFQPRVVVSSIQTQTASRGGRMRRFKPSEFSMLICDEAQHCAAESWKKTIAYYQQNPALKLVGCTATPDRADELALGQVFDSVAYTFELPDAIGQGWLVPIHTRNIHVESMDFSAVRTTAGDLNGKDMAEIMESEKNLHAIADPLIQCAGQRQTLIFAVSVAQAHRLAEILCRHRTGCARVVTGSTPPDERAQMLRDYAARRFQFLANCMIATEGWDCPNVEVVAMARPTKSRALYSQMVGRGSRALAGVVDGPETPDARRAAIAASEKPFAEIIDFVGNAGKHNLVSCADILGGKYPSDVVARAKKDARDMDPCDVEENLRAAAAALKSEAEERASAAARIHIKGKAKFTSTVNKAFATLGIGLSKKAPSDAGATAGQKRIIEAANFDASDMSAESAGQMAREIVRRRAAGMATVKQAATLKRYGLNPDCSFAEASNWMNILAANGWKKPLSLQGLPRHEAPAPVAANGSAPWEDPPQCAEPLETQTFRQFFNMGASR